jgi:hypothetical protein
MMNDNRKSLSYFLQGSFSFSNKYNLESGTPPNCCCHSDRFGKTLVAFTGADAASVIICLSDNYLETQFDGEEDAQPIENCSGIATEFTTQFLCLSSDSILVAIKTDTHVLIFHSSVFFGTVESNGSPPLQVYYLRSTFAKNE